MAVTPPTPEPAAGGLPQFDLHQWPGQMVWMLVIFIVMFVLFARVFVPRIGGTIADREDRIGGDIRDARRLRDEAEAQARAAAEEVAQARARGQKLAADTKASIAADTAARQAEEDSRLAQVLAEAEGRINVARTEAMSQVRGIASDAASAIIERLTGSAPATGEVERALAGVN